MQQGNTTFEIIMENCPFLKELIQDKITYEIGQKQFEIDSLKADYEERLQVERGKIAVLQEEGDKLKLQLTAAEEVSTATSLTQQELLELLIETGVI